MCAKPLNESLPSGLDVTDKDWDIIRWICKSPFFPKGAKIYAYGSRVNGKATRGSDLDLAIISADETPLSFKQICDIYTAFEWSFLPYKVDIVDIAKIPPSFKKNIDQQKLFLPIKTGEMA